MSEIRVKDLTKTLTYAQWLASFSPADSEANGTGKILGQTILDGIGNPHKVKVDASDPSETYLFDKILTDENLGKVIEAVGGIGTSYEAIRLYLENATYYVKGNTNYGGTLTDNLNTLARTTPFTCLGTATGVPDDSYSWFGWHINSNTGTAAAVQIAYAYTTSIICYERTKINNEWQAWTLRSAGSVSPEIGYVASGDSLGSTATIALQAGSPSQWSAHAVMCAASGKLTPAVGTSLFGFIVSQTIVGGHFIGAVYKVEDNGTHTKICSTGITEFPATAQWTQALISSLVTDKFIAPTERIYLTIMTDCNGVAVAGANAGSNLNLQPYIAAIKTNMGVLTEAPATIQWESETNTRPFIYMTK
jgi:hypothetical protein